MESEDDFTFFDLNDPGTTTVIQPETHRSTCLKCTRPVNVCLCSALPTNPIPTTSQIFIIHHPSEHHNNKLSTVPILDKSLLNATTIVARRLRTGVSPYLDSLSMSESQSPRTIYLFPPTHGHPSVNLSDLHSLYPSIHEEDGILTLIVFDGTWKHAKEMVNASSKFLSKFAIRVCLECDERVDGGSIYDSELILRKEPFGGCVSTMEAVARTLRVIEPNGIEIEKRLIHVLKEMVTFQKSYLKPMNPRPKMKKKGKNTDELRELNDRFNDGTVELLSLSVALDPSDHFKSFNKEDICNLAEKYYPQDFTGQEIHVLGCELEHYKLDVTSDPEFQQISSLCELCRQLVVTKKSNNYRLIVRLIRLVLTLPVSTATTERAFSAMKQIKTALRNKMEDEFLGDCMTLNIERELAMKIDFDSVIDEFYAMKPRRVQLK